jgi:uncharacterized membrane protein
MSRTKKTQSALFAAAAAALLMTAPVTASAKSAGDEIGKCWGVNSCKGSSNCKTVSSACAGKNACKAQGFLKIKMKQCDELSGDFESLVKK